MDLLTFAGACGLFFVNLTGHEPAQPQPCVSAVPSLTTAAPTLPVTALAPSLKRWDGYVAEAATRFGLPTDWIRNVMEAESRGVLAATSPAGAMGLMQVMPDTYDVLRRRYGLGSDPYDPHDNILAGAAYLREMYDTFGAPGFLAAYNAGPQRLADHLATARPLPAETRLYVAELAPKIAQSSAPVSQLPTGTDTGKTAPTTAPAEPARPPLPHRIGAVPAPPIPDGGSLFFTQKKPAAVPSDHARSGTATVKSNP